MKPPLILISPSTSKKGVEFADNAISLSNQYCLAVVAAGGLPWVAPCLPVRGVIAAAVQRCDGVLLTGGDDIQPELYARRVAPRLRRTICEPDPNRDLFELLLIEEIFRQGKPLLAICRGHQMLNVAFGGSLVIDIPTQVRGALDHRRMDLKNECVHEVALTQGSLLARITGSLELGVNSSHHQAIGRLAAPFAVTARSPDGVIEAMELVPHARPALPFFVAVQYHPERLFDRYPAHLALFQEFAKAAANGTNV